MFNLKFSTHPAWVSDCCCCKYLSCRRAARTSRALEHFLFTSSKRQYVSAYLKFPLSFPSEEYCRYISLGKCSTTSLEPWIPKYFLKKFWAQVLIQNKGRETRKDFPTMRILQTFFKLMHSNNEK